MEEHSRTRLSSYFFFTKSMLLAGWIISLLMLQDFDSVDRATGIEYILGALALSALLLYFISLPAIGYDQDAVYVSRIKGKEILVQYRYIHSIERSFFWTRGGRWYTMSYSSGLGENKKVKFFIDYEGNFPQFLKVAKKANPAIEVT